MIKKTLRFESQDPVRSLKARKTVFVVELQFSARINWDEPSLLKLRFLFPTSLSTRRERFRCLNVDYVSQLEEFNFLVFTHSVLVRVLDVVTSYLYQEQVPGDGLERVVVIIIRLCRSEDRNQTDCFLSMPKLPSVTCRQRGQCIWLEWDWSQKLVSYTGWYDWLRKWPNLFWVCVMQCHTGLICLGKSTEWVFCFHQVFVLV
jgi:hypothetical protein